jgi:serine/threonine protein kinase
MESLALEPGGTFGRYEMLTRLATGGMAEVWLAQFTGVAGFQKKVVLKTMLPHLAESPEFVRMFINEASLAARLNHPNIVHIFDLGELHSRYFIAMEYVAGKSLRQIGSRFRKAQKPMPLWFLLRVIGAACEGLQYAHDLVDGKGTQLGLVHRDVSPENLMVSFTGMVKLVDFGVAKATRLGAPVTKVGRLFGKFSYMAPERVHGLPADRRSDVYSLGVILYEFLTGTRPFAGDDEMQVLALVAEGKVRDMREIVPNIPKELVRITMTAIAPDPDERYQHAQDLGEDLMDYLSDNRLDNNQSIAVELSALFSESQEIPSNVKRTLAAPASSKQDRRKNQTQRVQQTVDLKARSRDADKTIIERVTDLVVRKEQGHEFSVDIVIDEASAPHPIQTAVDPAQERPSRILEELLQRRLSTPPSRKPIEPIELVVEPGPERSSAFQLPVPRVPLGELKSDVFSIYRPPRTLTTADLFTSARRARSVSTGRSPEPALRAASELPSSTPRSWGPTSEAAKRFERGLELLGQREYGAALLEWEGALELEPENRSYQSNLKRLRKLLLDRAR